MAFGVFQSKETDKEALMANIKSFIANDADWDEANREIVDEAGSYEQEPYPAINELEKVVTHEVRYQKAIWSGDYERALTEARAILAGLTAPELRGYRALWHYLAGSVSQMLSVKPGDSAERIAREQFVAAKGAAPSVPWLAPLAREEAADENGEGESLSMDTNVQVERLEGVLLALGTASDHKFEKLAKEILDALRAPNAFEEGQRQLGKLLGFIAGNNETDAAPDPWWLGATMGLVFEDHADGEATSVFRANKVKQAALHPDWLEENVPEAKGLDLKVALVTPCTSAGRGAKPALKKVLYWPIDEFRIWAADAVDVVRSLKSALPPGGDLFWRINAADKLTSNGLTIKAIIDTLPVASEEMTFIS